MFAVLPASVLSPANYSSNPVSGFYPGYDYGTSGGLNRRRITIYRDSLTTPWGFRLQGGRDHDSPLSVKRVFSGSPADGQLTRDDLILAINDRLTDDLRHAEALELIREAGGSIDLTIDTSLELSGGGGAPAPVSHSSSFAAEFAHQGFQPLLQNVRPTFSEEPVHHGFHPISQDPPSPAIVPSYQAQEPTEIISEEIARQTLHHHQQPSYSPKEAKVDIYDTQPGYRYQDLPAREPGRQKVAHRFRPPTERLPTGMGEMGWVAKPKQVHVVAARALQSQSAYQEPHQRPVVLQSSFSSVDEPKQPAWYGSLRNTRVPHSFESKAARIQSPLLYEDAHAQTWSEQHQQPPHPVHSARSKSSQQIYRAEIRDLILARPTGEADAYSEYFDGAAHSAPQTPIVVSRDEEVQPPLSHSELQSSPKIQPSMLFGTVFTSKTAQLSQPRSRTQAQQVAITTRTAPKPSPLSVSQTPEPNPLTAQLFQQISPSMRDRPVQPAKAPAQPQQVPQTQYPNTRPSQTPTQNFSASQQRQEQPPSSSSQVPVTHHQPDQGKPDKPSRGPETPVERFNPGPNKRSESSRCVILVERFNPGPEKPGKPSGGAAILVERFNPGPEKPGKPSGGAAILVECFNPGPEKPGKPSGGAAILVERFNPGPEKPGKPSGGAVTLVERFNPGPDRDTKQPSHFVTRVERFNPGSEGSGKSSGGGVSLVERFNPGSDRSGKSPHGRVTLVERFNPGSERSGKSSGDRVTLVERFNPGPERP